MKTNLQELLKRFDEPLKSLGLGMSGSQADFIKSHVYHAIKDALEACRNSKEDFDHGEHTNYYNMGWNANTTQYDENVKSFLGEEV